MSEQAWYRHGWPWVLISIPFAAVLFGVLMIFLATEYPDDLVDDDYYRDGMTINRSLEMDHRAARLGIKAEYLATMPGRIAFRIEGADDSAVMLRFFHVTDKDLDLSLVLYPEEGDIYASGEAVPAVLMEKGIWYIQLSGVDGLWRLRGRIETPLATLELAPHE